MKKKNVLITLASSALALCASLGAVCLSVETADAATQTPSLTIAGQNLSFQDNIYLYYAVETENLLETDDFGLLLWTETQDTYEYANAQTKLVSRQTQTIEGVEYPIFTYNKLCPIGIENKEDQHFPNDFIITN